MELLKSDYCGHLSRRRGPFEYLSDKTLFCNIIFLISPIVYDVSPKITGA